MNIFKKAREAYYKDCGIGKFSAEEIDLKAMCGTRKNIAIEGAEMWIKYFSEHTEFPTWAPFKIICLYAAWVVFNSNRRTSLVITESEWKSNAKEILTQAQRMYNVEAKEAW